MPRASSIFDDDFVSLLEKQAQTTEFGTDYQLVSKMINRLLAQTTSGAKYHSDTGKQPKQEDLGSLDKFIDYLSNHIFRSTDDGSLIVLPEPTDEQKRQELIDNGYLPYPSKKVYIHTDGLLEVLKHFDQQAKASNNLYLQELVDKLINDVETKDLGMRPGTVRQELAKEETKKQAPSASLSTIIPTTDEKSHPAIPEGETQKAPTQIPGQAQSNQPNPIQLKETLKELGVSEEELLPYDPTSKSINVNKMLSFIRTVNGLTNRVPELRGYYTMLSGAMNRVYSELGAWQTNPNIPSNAQGGFFFSPGTLQIDNFVMQYADKKYPLAMEMLAKMQDICLNLNSILHIMSTSPGLVGLIGKSTLTNQLEIGEAYTRAFSDAGSLLRSHNPSFGSGSR